jgi:hypothetical protein
MCKPQLASQLQSASHLRIVGLDALQLAHCLSGICFIISLMQSRTASRVPAVSLPASSTGPSSVSTGDHRKRVEAQRSHWQDMSLKEQPHRASVNVKRGAQRCSRWRACCSVPTCATLAHAA